MHKTWVVTRKEWAEVFKNRFVLFTIAFLPLMLTALPLGLGFGIFATGVRLMSVSPAVAARLLDPVWLVAVFIVGPLLALAAVSVAVMVSSRVNDPRVAEQVSMLVILPLPGLFFGQIAGLIYINQRLILLMAGVLVVADALLLTLATQLFERETILTRWK